MAEVTDPDGVAWTVHRRWWPFDLTWIADDSIAVMIVCAVPFVVFWPFWLLAKTVGVKWRIDIDRANTRVGHELVGGWRRSGERIDAIAAEITQGQRAVPA